MTEITLYEGRVGWPGMDINNSSLCCWVHLQRRPSALSLFDGCIMGFAHSTIEQATYKFRNGSCDGMYLEFSNWVYATRKQRNDTNISWCFMLCIHWFIEHISQAHLSLFYNRCSAQALWGATYYILHSYAPCRAERNPRRLPWLLRVTREIWARDQMDRPAGIMAFIILYVYIIYTLLYYIAWYRDDVYLWK